MTNIDRAADIIAGLVDHPETPNIVAQALADATPPLLMPDQAQTAAGMTWEYRTEEWSGNYWYPCGPWDADAALYEGYTPRTGERLVRRPVGPVEVVPDE